MSEKIKLDAFYVHEALHTARLAADFVADNLLDHPAIEQNPDWSARA